MAAGYTLPAEVQLEYLAEGAANIVYKTTWPHNASSRDDGTQTIPAESDLHNLPSATSSATPPPTEIDPAHPPEADTHPPTHLRDRLLRLRKAVPWIPSYSQLHETQAKLINHHFPPTHLVAQDLVLLPAGLAKTLNAGLRANEESGARLAKRHGLYLAEDEPHGMLVQDMSPDTSKGETLIEVKPKWLAQSPNAPQGSTRCRTCALRAMRRDKAKGKDKAVDDDERDFCPLALGSGDPMAVDACAHAIVAAAGSRMDGKDEASRAALQQALAMFFLTTQIIPRLEKLQKNLDPDGILALPETGAGGSEGEVPKDGFLVATTLRDCTLFVRVGPSTSGGGALSVEGRLGDLDLKAPEPGKIEYWRGLERELVEGGWYNGIGTDGKCYLEASPMFG